MILAFAPFCEKRNFKLGKLKKDRFSDDLGESIAREDEMNTGVVS